MSKRIYIAVAVGAALNPNTPPRLVNAGTPAAARLHVTRSLFDIRVATPHEVAQHVGKGVKVEEAGEEQQTAPLPNMPGSLDLTQPSGSQPEEPLPADPSFEEMRAAGAHRS